MSRQDPKISRCPLWLGLLIFTLALLLRLLFWQATPDYSGAYTAYYKGDAPYWLAYADALREGKTFELGLPLRPPGVPYLLAFVWNGEVSGLRAVRFLWCLLGSIVSLLVYIAVLRSFGLNLALIAGLWTASSTGLLVLSTSLNNEIPYLLLITGILVFWEPVLHRPGFHHLFLFAGLNALACLIRVEHVLFFILLCIYLFRNWTIHTEIAPGWKTSLLRTGFVLLIFALVLTPWHLHAWSRIQDFNQEPLPTNAATERALRQAEASLRHLEWAPDALQEREKLPAFSRNTSATFVAATVAARGGARVTAEDFSVLEEAFGYRPEPVDPHPFVVLYGGLNFLLANNPAASGGFNRAPLEEPPPLAGGVSRYPSNLVLGLPPPQLTLTYPPHLRVLNHGYLLGLDWILHDPGAYLKLAAEKLEILWAGASLGFTGYNLPLGLSGLRRPVDLVVPEGSLASVWRFCLLLVAGLGLYAGWNSASLLPWGLFLLSKVLATLAFFGYAREGATVIPVVAVLTGLAFQKWIFRASSENHPRGGEPGRRIWIAVLLAILAIGMEAYRWTSAPTVLLDGHHYRATDPFPLSEYQQRLLQVR